MLNIPNERARCLFRHVCFGSWPCENRKYGLTHDILFFYRSGALLIRCFNDAAVTSLRYEASIMCLLGF